METKEPDFVSTMSRTIKCNHCSKLLVNQQGLFYTVKKQKKIVLYLQMLQHTKLYLSFSKISASVLLLRSHEASQHTNFGRVRTSQFAESGSFEKFRMYITAFASISSNRNRGSFDSEEKLHRQSGIDVEEKILIRVESHVFAGEEFESK